MEIISSVSQPLASGQMAATIKVAITLEVSSSLTIMATVSEVISATAHCGFQVIFFFKVALMVATA